MSDNGKLAVSRIVSAAAAIAILALSLSACEDRAQVNGNASATQYPEQILTDFTVEMTRGELRSATFSATRGEIYRKRDSMVVETLEAMIYDEAGKFSSSLWADSGLIRERKKQMIAVGNVRVLSNDSLHLTSDSLFWYGEQFARAPIGGRLDTARKEEPRRLVAKSNVYLLTNDSIQLWTDTLLWNDMKQSVATDAYVTIVRRRGDTLRGWGLRSDDQLKSITILKASGTLRERSE